MLDFNTIIEKAFNEKFEILKEIKCGLRCQTYLVKVKNNKYIFQIYTDKTIYQAKKKYNMLNKINSKFIPKSIKVEENEEYSYLITEYFEGESLYYYRHTSPDFKMTSISRELAIVLGQVHKISYIQTVSKSRLGDYISKLSATVIGNGGCSVFQYIGMYSKTFECSLVI